MIIFGVVGYGYWGPNIVRNLDNVEGVRIQTIADKSPICKEASTSGASWSSDYG